MPASGPAIQRVQLRQLLDLLSQPAQMLGSGKIVEAAIVRFEELEVVVCEIPWERERVVDPA